MPIQIPILSITCAVSSAFCRHQRRARIAANRQLTAADILNKQLTATIVYMILWHIRDRRTLARAGLCDTAHG